MTFISSDRKYYFRIKNIEVLLRKWIKQEEVYVCTSVTNALVFDNNVIVKKLLFILQNEKPNIFSL